MGSFSVYAIVNERGVIYIGYTDSIEKRLKRHNGELSSKHTSFTRKQGGKWRLIHKEECGSRVEAMRREKQLKCAKGREFVRKKLVQGEPAERKPLK